MTPDQTPGQLALSFNCEHDLELIIETDGGQHWGYVDYGPSGAQRQPLAEILTPEHIMGLAGENNDYPFDVWKDEPATHKSGVDVVATVNELLNSRPAAISATPLPRMPESSFEGRHAGQPAKAPGRFGGDDVDLAVDTVMSGPLSRGIASADRRQAVQTWHEWAQRRGAETGDEDYAEFAAGIKTGITALYESHLGEDKPDAGRFDGDNIPTYTIDLALQAAAKKRTTGQSREHWRRLLKHTPSESWHRGHLAAGVILSGADGYWGMRSDPEHAAKGAPGS